MPFPYTFPFGFDVVLTPSDAGSGSEGSSLLAALASAGFPYTFPFRFDIAADNGLGADALIASLSETIASEAGLGYDRLRAAIRTSAGAFGIRLPTSSQVRIPSKGVNL